MKDIVTREKTVFENQKADIQRLLGAEGRPKKPHREFPHGGGCVCSRCKRVWDIFGYIDHLEQGQTDALALLDNMDEEAPPENPKEPNINIYGNVHGRIHIDKGVYLHLHGNHNAYKPDDYDGPWPFPEDDDSGTFTFQPIGPGSMLTSPAEEPVGNDRHHDVNGKRYPNPADYGPYPRPMCPDCKVFMEWHFPEDSIKNTYRCPKCGHVKEPPAEDLNPMARTLWENRDLLTGKKNAEEPGKLDERPVEELLEEENPGQSSSPEEE